MVSFLFSITLTPYFVMALPIIIDMHVTINRLRKCMFIRTQTQEPFQNMICKKKTPPQTRISEWYKWCGKSPKYPRINFMHPEIYRLHEIMCVRAGRFAPKRCVGHNLSILQPRIVGHRIVVSHWRVFKLSTFSSPEVTSQKCGGAECFICA